MVARISHSVGVNGSLSYNENKVKKGKAALLAVYGYSKEVTQLSFTDKLRRLEKLTSLNKLGQVHGVHISLNFSPQEKVENLDNTRLEEIASRYMEGIGFGSQPYLIYRHFDAGHPHLHIVTTNIQRDGSRISLHNIGRNQSENTRKEIERNFGLVPAGGSQKEQYRIEKISPRAIQYGKEETKKTISEVVREIVRAYKFTSLHELNAVLKQFNVMADRGSDGSFLHKKGGLQYRLLDKEGAKVGVPIKASAVSTKPTLKMLEKKFQVNNVLRQPYKELLKKEIGSTLFRNTGGSRQQFEKELQAKNITVVFRQNDLGRVYGITYIDNNSKSVFNGSDLGKAFSANAVMEKLSNKEKNETLPKQSITGITDEQSFDLLSRQSSLLDDLLTPEQEVNLANLMPKRKKKKKRRPNL